jgi:hypothetical protein
MGTVTNFTDTVTTSFSGSDKLDFLFAYALYDNNGTIPTTAPLSSDMGPTNTIISQAQAISSQTQPVVVVYNLNLSVGLNIDGTGNKQYDPKELDYNFDIICNILSLSLLTPINKPQEDITI